MNGMLLKYITIKFIDASIAGYVLGVLLILGAILSYIPQFYVIFKYKTIDGLDELSIITLNIGNFCLTLNSIIFNWNKWLCFSKNGFFICNAQLLPFYQIFIGWLMAVVFYVIFIKYKIRNTDEKIIHVIFYSLCYIGFIIIAITIVLFEKLGNSGSSQNYFFNGFAQAMGYISMICSAIVWLPQIYTLIKSNKTGIVSPLMFALQAPGNIISIIFQAVLYKQHISTWITYAVTCVEQTIIIIIIGVYWVRDRRYVHHQYSFEDDINEEIEVLV